VVSLETKKIFKQLLSFLVAASLVHVPIACANNFLPEWTQDAAMNAYFLPVFTDWLALNPIKRGGGEKPLQNAEIEHV
jgi:hypothetical protein